MDMDRKMMYAFRGWIAFVAFMDLGTTVRSYIEKRSFLSKSFEDETTYVDEEYTTSRILGIFSVLKALALIHCTLYIHYKPVVSMGILSLLVTIVMYLTETLYFRAATLNFYVVFPCVLNCVTLAALIYLPQHLKIWDLNHDCDDDNVQFMKHSGGVKRRRHMRKNNN